MRLIPSELLRPQFAVQILFALGGTTTFSVLESPGATGTAPPWRQWQPYGASNLMLWELSVLLSPLVGAQLGPVMP